ncbi:MAG TPA: hypothetical protein PLN53_01795 [Terricaulis sp.]|nr:hypothetical protein [Terricaulis sp.]
MRWMIAALALCAAACSEPELAGGPDAQNPAGGYTLEVRADQSTQVFLVTGPDGRSVAGRAADGVSGIMDTEAARAFTVMPEGEEPLPEVMALRFPGFDLSVSGEGDASNAEGARVSINAGGRTVEVNAREDSEGVNERAHVRITGASEADVRDFISDADELSPETQAQMLTALGLN